MAPDDGPWSVRTLDDAHLAADDAFAAVKRARWHRLDVSREEDAVFAATAGAFRRGVRKAEQAGIEVAPLEGDAGVEAFAALHAGLRRRKYGMLSQPLAFFAALRDRFEPLGGWHPLGAFSGGRLVAATVYLRWGDVLYYKFNASDPDALAARPNNALLWAGARHARSLR